MKTESWIAGRVKCDLCNHVWLSVFHSTCKKLECPNCGFMANYDLITIDEEELRSKWNDLTDEYFNGIL